MTDRILAVLGDNQVMEYLEALEKYFKTRVFTIEHTTVAIITAFPIEL